MHAEKTCQFICCKKSGRASRVEDEQEGEKKGCLLHGCLYGCGLKSMRKKSLIQEVKHKRKIEAREDRSLLGILIALVPGLLGVLSSFFVVADIVSDLVVFKEYRQQAFDFNTAW